MKALQYEGLRKVVLKEIPEPKIGAGEVLLAAEACGLCGSDILKIDSKLRGPVPLGHELAGRIAEIGVGVTSFKKGDRVVVSHHVPCLECHYCAHGQESMCREFKQTNLDPGGFSELVRVSARHVEHVMFKIPAKLSFARAAMTEPLACCLRNIRRLGLHKGDCAVVIGLGFIGLMTAKLLLRDGVTVIGLDLDPARVLFAQKLGITHAYTGQEGRTKQIISSLSESRGADALIFSAGPSSLVPERFDWVRDGGIINIFAGYHKSPNASINLDAIYHRELTILTSYSPQLEDLREAHRLIVEGEIDVAPFAVNTFPLDQFAEALRQVRGREIVKAILLPQNSSGKSK